MTELHLAGTTLGRFEIISELGRGGMAVVYKARQTDLDRIVAFKILPPALTHDPSYVARFRQEARSAARLEHPHIMPIYEVGESNGLHYIAMKFIEGRTLKDLVQDDGALSVPRAAQVLGQVGEALDHAHRQGVIHRDIKPSNIMITDEGWVYLTDFGLARGTNNSGSNAGLTIAGTVMGTPEYMSPEQAQGLPNVGPPTDIYALGVVLYELITGTFPFQADTPMGMLAARLLQAPTPPRDVRGDLPTAVEDVVMRALARKPEARFASAAEMVAALRAAAGLSAAQAQRPLTPLGGTPAIGATIVAGQPAPSTPGTGAPRFPAPTPLPPLPAAPTPPSSPPYVKAPALGATAPRPQAAPVWQGTIPHAPTTPAGAPPAYLPPPGSPARPRNRNLLIGAGAGVLVLLLALVGGLVMLGRSSNDPRDPDPVNPADSPIATLIAEGDPELSDQANLDAVISGAQRSLDSDGGDLGALGRLALAYYLRADWPNTEEYANQLIAAADGDDSAAALGYSLLADTLLTQGDVASGLSEVEEAIALDPDLSLAQAVRSNALAAQARAANDSAQMDAALSSLDQAVDSLGDESALIQALTHNALAYTFSQEYFLNSNQDYFDQSLASYERAIELQPDLAVFHSNLGYLHSADEDYRDARAAFEEALDLDPDFAAAHSGIGWTYYNEDDPEQAEAAFDAAIDTPTGDYFAHYGKGRLRFDEAETADQYAAAVSELEAAIELNARSPEVLGWLGEALLFEGFNTDEQADKETLYADAEEAYRKALELDERFIFARSGLGWILQYQERYEESVDEFERAIAIDTTSDEVYNGLAWSLFYQDKFAEAEPNFRRATELDPEYVDAHIGLGRTLGKLGRNDEARAALEEALSLDPGNQRAQDGLDELGG